MRTRLAVSSLLILCLCPLAALAGPNEDLMAACKAGSLDGATKALEAGAKVNEKDADGATAISVAYFWPEITKLLLSKGADANLGAGSAVVGAASNYSTEVLKLLLDAGADPNKPTYASSSAGIKMLIAAEKAKGKDGNQTNIAAWEGLLKNPAVINAKPVEYFALRTALYGSSCVPCVEMLLARKARLDQGVADGTMMHVFADSISPTPETWKAGFAAGKSNMEALGLKLPEWYAETLPADRIGTAEQMLKLLLAKGLKINERNKGAPGIGPLTPLEMTLNQGLGLKRHIMLALIANGADVKLIHKTYGPLIIQAAQCGFADVVKAMVEKGADINQRGTVWTNASDTSLLSTFTPLTAAAVRNKLEVVRYLVEAGANIGAGVDGQIRSGTCLLASNNKSALFFAIETGNLELVTYLVEHNGFDGKPYTFRPTTVSGLAGCILKVSGTMGPSAWASQVNAPQPIIDYLRSKSL